MYDVAGRSVRRDQLPLPLSPRAEWAGKKSYLMLNRVFGQTLLHVYADDGSGVQVNCGQYNHKVRTSRTAPSAPAETMVRSSSHRAALVPPACAFLKTAFCIGRATDHT